MSFPQGQIVVIRNREFFKDRAGNYTLQCKADSEATFCIGEIGDPCIFCDRKIWGYSD